MAQRSGCTFALAALSQARLLKPADQVSAGTPTLPNATVLTMQGVIKSFDPSSGVGIIMCDSDLADYDLASDALEGSVFRMLRQGQRVVFDLDDAGCATFLRLGSEVDMGTPGH